MKNGFTSPKEVRPSLSISSPLLFSFLTSFLVTLRVKARKVYVKGGKGEITKSFRHMPVEMRILKQNAKKRQGMYLNIKMWNAGKKQACSVSTLKSLVRNMITGVTDVSSLSSIFYILSLY